MGNPPAVPPQGQHGRPEDATAPEVDEMDLSADLEAPTGALDAPQGGPTAPLGANGSPPSDQ